MALIVCSECGKQVSDKASSCPNCGNPMVIQAINYPPSRPATPTNSEENLLHCPKCNSTQLSSNKKGFSGGKALTGAVLTGGIGLLAGTIGSGDVSITCLKCGYKYNAGEYVKEKQKFEREREISRKTASGEQSFAGIIILFLILSIIGSIISFKLFANSWPFLGVIFSIATLLCLGMFIFSINSEYNRKPKN